MVNYSVDYENNAILFWDSLNERLKSMDVESELYQVAKTLLKKGSVTLHDAQLIQNFDNFVTSLPGWEDGPAYAPTALHVNKNLME